MALGLVIFTRIQGVAVLAAYAGAALLYCLTQPRRERLPYARRFLPTLIVAIPVALAPVVASVARGEGVFGWLGQRSGTFDEFHLHEVPYWFVLLAVGLVLYVAVAPAVATTIMVVAWLRGGADDGLRLYAAVVLPTVVAMLLSVAFVSASFDVDEIGNLNERYVFHVVPLLFVGLALWIERGLPRPRPRSWLVLGVACLAPVLLPIERLDYNAGLQALALVPWDALSLNAAGTALLVGLVTIGAGAVWLTARPGATAGSGRCSRSGSRCSGSSWSTRTGRRPGAPRPPSTAARRPGSTTRCRPGAAWRCSGTRRGRGRTCRTPSTSG